MVIIFGKAVNILVGQFPEGLVCPVFLLSCSPIFPLTWVAQLNAGAGQTGSKNDRKVYQ
jgi:hypothetical protein